MTLARLITPQTRPQALTEITATIGTEASARLARALDASPYTLRHNGLSTSRCKAWLDRYLAGHEFSPTSVRRAIDYVKYYRRLGSVRGRVLDYGCGLSNPLGVGVLLYLNGVQGVVAVDPGKFDAELSSASLKELSIGILADPGRFDLASVGTAELMRRFAALDWASLYRLESTPQVQLVNGTSADVEGRFDTVISTSVLEHVSDMPGELRRLHAMTNPGARMIHRIDLTDHRHHMAGYHRFAFMRDGTLHGINSLRSCDYLRLFEEAGFRVERADKSRVELDEAFLKSVKPPFDRYDADELAVTVVNVVAVRV
jgi:SAM-dependent methyltransferase